MFPEAVLSSGSGPLQVPVSPVTRKRRINTPGSTPVRKRQMSTSDVLLPPFLRHSPVPSPTETCWISHLHRSMNVGPLAEEPGQSSQSETWSQTDTAFRGRLEGTVDGQADLRNGGSSGSSSLNPHSRSIQLLSASCPISLVRIRVTHLMFYRPDLLKSQSGGLTNYPCRVLPPSHLMGPGGLWEAHPQGWCPPLQATAACRHSSLARISEQDT